MIPLGSDVAKDSDNVTTGVKVELLCHGVKVA
ncbi:hypothetical protein BOTU111922_19905 [Bordetella tumulicola]